MEQTQNKESNTKMIVALTAGIVLFLGGAAALVAWRNGIFLIPVALGIASVLYSALSGRAERKANTVSEENAPRAKTDWTLLKYYLIMAGILVAEIGLLYLVFMIQAAGKLIYVLSALAVFIGIAVFLIVVRIRERAKVKPVSEVLGGYLRVTAWVTVALFGLFVVLILVKSASLFAIFH
ncbi:MAG: hypothetical protein A2Y33_09355 [Spirochaetes bacterium GWF1_51_8]|nr:MAG: hypothetical protein A2Y33_09355 [Spirochaetes bacterium GWF1_51_8]